MSSTSNVPNEADITTLVISFLVIVLATIVAALRFYVRIFTKAGIGADDWMIAGAIISTIVTAALLIWANVIDPGASNTTDPDYEYTENDVISAKITFTILVLYYALTGATKLGILLMYFRIFSVYTRVRYQIYGLEFLVVGWWLACTIALLAGCTLFTARWGKGAVDPNRCFNLNVFWAASGACEVFIDILILNIPMIMVARMNLPLKQKLLVTGIFLLGGLSIATGLVKVVLGYSPGTREIDYTTKVWSAVHSGTAIVCANLPLLRPLYNKFGEHLSQWRYKHSRTSYDSCNPYDMENIREPSSGTSTENLQYPSPLAWSKERTWSESTRYESV
ncbi:uncharacterized protein GGS22DRAFT_194838 [Annulohypoxylon maeteangense]|uniref:uncharacterized protein n=1 Tax=Annulohypoxylon maeteangense TaxID=1927788 RepID=UPI002007D5AF|nr:uncharacterized protein GGS22DRAFT_194838 [Annulohypoxylon maeteangense]KAI0884297.1 hypothetical protein GGS22DRAFT_194838 [Annulohypoxylon maeteangense]